MTAAAHDLPDEQWLEQQLAEALDRIHTGGALALAERTALVAARPHLRSQFEAALGLRDLFVGVLQPTASDLTGVRIADRYRLAGELGRGAAGVVHRAFDEHLRREVAIKLLHQGRIDGAAVARFVREARVLAQMTHASIVRIHDHGTASDGRQYLVMELLAGTSLQTILAAATAAMPAGPSAATFRAAPWLSACLPHAALEPSCLRQVVRWIVQLGEGLQAAHAAGIWHRDVKPGNVFVRSDGSAVLLDFGIAARAGEAGLTQEHAIVGTPCYMAPEQAAGRSEPGPLLDVYGLAATLYHLLTLRPPFEGDLRDVLQALRDEEPRPAGTVHRGLPVDLQAILDHGLARRPQHRYPNVQRLVADLQAFLDHRPVSVRPLGPVRRTCRRLSRHPLRVATALSALLAVVALSVAIPSWTALSTAATAARAQELLARLPADLAIEGWPDERLLVPLTEQRRLLAEIDHLIELEPANAAVRVLRAALQLDAGQRELAAADLALLAGREQSPYLRAVAARFTAADAGRAGIAAVDLNGLPEPATAADCFVAGFHALRARDSESADSYLARAGDFPPARDLRILAMLGKKQPDAEAIVAEAGRLEGLYGRATARTRHALGAAMLMMRRWEKAAAYCQEALDLRPDRHGPWNNLGLARLRLGQLDAARHCYERAVAIRPWFANSLSGLSQTLRALGDFRAARASASTIRDECWREHELGNIDVAEALLAKRRRESSRQRELANAATSHFAAARAVTAGSRNPRVAGLATSAAYAQALAADDFDGAVGPFVDMVRGEPRNAQQLANLADLLADQVVDAPLRDRLRLLLLDLAVDLAPEDAGNRAMREALRQELQQPELQKPQSQKAGPR